MRVIYVPLVIGVPLLLSGCASLSPDGGFNIVRDMTQAGVRADVEKISTSAQVADARDRVSMLLRAPMTAERAVQIALLNNRGLQAEYNDLGVSEAEYVQAALPPNPRLSLSRAAGGLDLDIERQLVVDLISVLTLPTRAEVARLQIRAAQMRAVEATLKLAADARRQFYRAVAAGQIVSTLERARAAAQVSSELAQKLGETGALNKLGQAREHALTAEVDAQLARARLQQRLEREKLVRLLGLWGNELAFRLPAALPPLPARLVDRSTVEAEAIRRRVDLQAARLDLEALAKNYGLTQATRFVNALEVSGIDNYERSVTRSVDADGQTQTDVDRVRKRGIGIELEIPLFDFGQTRVAQAEQTYMRAVNRLAEKAVNARSQAREAYQAWRGNYDIARLYQRQVLPLRKTIQDESLLQYSGMLIDVSQLILDARARIMSQAQAIEAQRDFWIAQSDLHATLIGGASGTTTGGASPVTGGTAAAD